MAEPPWEGTSQLGLPLAAVRSSSRPHRTHRRARIIPPSSDQPSVSLQAVLFMLYLVTVTTTPLISLYRKKIKGHSLFMSLERFSTLLKSIKCTFSFQLINYGSTSTFAEKIRTKVSEEERLNSRVAGGPEPW